MIKRVAIWTMVISLGEITLYARELLTDAETKNVKLFKLLEEYWRTCGVQLICRVLSWKYLF